MVAQVYVAQPQAVEAERVEAQQQVGLYGLAARVYRGLMDTGWDRDEAAETVDWLLGQGRTASDKEEVLRGFAQRNEIATDGNGNGK